MNRSCGGSWPPAWVSAFISMNCCYIPISIILLDWLSLLLLPPCVSLLDELLKQAQLLPQPFPSKLSQLSLFLVSSLFISFLLLLLQWLLPPNYLWALQTPLAPQNSVILVLFSCLLTSRFARCWTAANITIFENLDASYRSCKSRNVSSYCFVTMAAKIQFFSQQISVYHLQCAALILAKHEAWYLPSPTFPPVLPRIKKY